MTTRLAMLYELTRVFDEPDPTSIYRESIGNEYMYVRTARLLPELLATVGDEYIEKGTFYVVARAHSKLVICCWKSRCMFAQS